MNKNDYIPLLGFSLSEANSKQSESIINFIKEVTEKDYIAFIEFGSHYALIFKFIDDSKGIKVVNDNQYLLEKLVQKYPKIVSFGINVSCHKDDLFKGYLTTKAVGRIIRGMAKLTENTPIEGPFIVPMSLENKLDEYINLE